MLYFTFTGYWQCRPFGRQRAQEEAVGSGGTEGGAVGCLKESTTKYITPPFARRAFGRWEEVVVVVCASKEILQRQEIRKKKAPHSSVGSVGSAVAI